MSLVSSFRTRNCISILMIAFMLLGSGSLMAQNALPFTEAFSSAYSSHFFHSAGTGNAGSTMACTLGDYVGAVTSNDYLTTNTCYVSQGKGLSISFQLKSGGTFTAPDVYVRINNAYAFSTLSTTDNGWVKIGSATTTACGTNTFTVGSDIIGGQKFSVVVHFRNASGTNWVSIENFSMTETTGSSVQTSYTENFSSNTWWNSGSFPKISYHSNSSSGSSYVSLFSGGVGGSFDYYGSLSTGYDPSTTNMITEEINIGAYAKGELRYSFRSQYPCGGPNSYTFDETYSLYAPKAYIQVGADNGSNAWQLLPVSSYFPDATWRYAAVDISAYKNSNIKIKFERGGFCSNPQEGVDNIKVLDRDCSISGLTCGAITGSSSPAASTDYPYSVAAVSGATYYKWMVRNGGTLYEGSPYIVSGQGTQNATINFGTLASPLRVICIPFDANPSTNTDACYAKLAYLSMAGCSNPVISSSSFTNPTNCPGTTGTIVLNGLTASTTYAVTYSKNGNAVASANYTTDGSGVLTIGSLTAGTYTNVVATLSACSSTPVAGPFTLTDPTVPAVATPVFNLGATSARCAGAGSVTYTATASNSTGITYSLDNTATNAGNSINANSGAVTWASGYAGAATITATATGCSGPTTATHTVTVSAAVGTPAFNNGLSSTRCQGAGVVTYTATSTNSTGITYKLDALALAGGNTIDTTTGQVIWAAGYSGTGSVTASAAGCGGPATAVHTVTISPIVGTPVFSLGASSSKCQGANTITYTASASNTNAVSYSLDITSSNAGNIINAGTGAVIWSAGYSGSATVTATAAGCGGPLTATHTVTITASVLPSVNIAAAPGNDICSGTVVTFFVTVANEGSSPVYVWKKNNNVVGGNAVSYADSALAQGDLISCSLTSNAGCASPATVTATAITMTVRQVPDASIVSVNNPTCEGNTLQLNCQQVSNAVYSWTGPAGFFSAQQNPSITNVDSTNAGAYYLSINVNGCESTVDTMDVLVNQKPEVPLISQNGNTLTSTAATSYQWYLGNTAIGNANAQNYTVTQSGLYSVEVTGANGCRTFSNAVNMIVSGIEVSSGNRTAAKVFPNPFMNELSIVLQKQNIKQATFIITNVLGQEVYRKEESNLPGQTVKVIDLNKLPSGVYYVAIEVDGEKMVKQVVKE